MKLLRKLVSLMFISLMATGCLGAWAANATILVVESYNAEYAWDVSYTSAIKEELGGDYKLEFFHMDTKRLPPQEHQAMANAAWERYQILKPVLVILGDDAALKFLAPRLAKTETPVVYLGINNNPRAYYDLRTVKNITGVLERPILKRNIIVAREIVPNAKRILVLFDTDLTAQVLLKESFGGNNRVDIAGATVDLALIGDWDTWKKAVLDAKGRYDILFVGLYQTLKDRNGKNVDPEAVVRWSSENSPVPLFGFWDFSVGADKTVGGLVLYGEEQGKAAAGLARKILSGASPSSLGPVTAERGNLLFSRKQLERFKLTVPPVLAQEASYID